MKGTRADVVFASCTNLRTFEVIVEAEVELHRPVLSANQVTIWSCLRAADLPLPAIDQALFSVDR
jgi:maleate isomerase